MALMHVDYFSNVLGMCMNMDVIIPQTTSGQIGLEGRSYGTYPTLYLLHGMSDDHTIWQRRTSIERYVTYKNIAVVMPSTHLAWYADMECGYRNYFTFISKELPEICRGFFPRMSTKREETWIAGLSMGGYGALKTALWESGTFGKAVGLSGSYCIEAREGNPYWDSIFGKPGTRTKHTVEYAAEMLAAEEREKPEIYMACGTEDGLIECNRKLRDFLKLKGYNVTYKEAPGCHSWEFWDTEIQPALDWLTKQ
ncbi:MAG: alpha/beta hydrolase family protein [Eubacteriales bacterium]|nr:alpha/beta hydrolase family protein [Eubacteriales bacterium]